MYGDNYRYLIIDSGSGGGNLGNQMFLNYNTPSNIILVHGGGCGNRLR